MISGVKRKSTATESTKRFYQTVDLIISHFKRDADRKKIFELTSQDTTLKNLLIATAAIHLYHNLGIRVNENLDMGQISVDSTKNLELMEKNTLREEVESLLQDSLDLEINMLLRSISLENNIISFLINERKKVIDEQERKRILSDIEGQIEKDMLEIVLKYPPFYFYDLVGDLIGINNDIKIEILEGGSAFKDLSIDIERKLEVEEKEDKFIELSTLNHTIKKIQKDYEFKSYKELQMEAMPVRMIKRKVMEYNLNRFPVSLPGLLTFLESNKIKKDLIEKISLALNEKQDYVEFEKNILSYLKSKLIEQLNTNPNDFIYFLESLNENNFNEIIYALNKHGVYNILHLINIDEDIAQKVKKNLIRYNIDKFDIMSLNDNKANLILLANKVMCESDFSHWIKDVEDKSDLSEFSLLEGLHQENENINKVWKSLEEKIGFSQKDFKQYVRKKEIVDKFFIQDLNLKNYSQILLLLNFDEILTKLATDIFYYIFSKITRQISRIIELYSKISNEKALILVALKKMYGTTETEQWVWVKLEELIISRLLKRQKELVVVFNALNKPFLINGFILARLTDISLKGGIAELVDQASPIYKDVKPLKLKHDIISPVSYCIAYDLIKRFETFEELRKLKVKQVAETKEKEKEKKKKKIREQQEISTLNWIERRITSSLMRITSPGINPNQLYWQDKDTKIVTDNIKLHSELNGSILDLFTEYFHFAIDKVRLHSDIKLPNYEKLYDTVILTAETLLEKRLGHSPSPAEVKDMLDGERFEIAKQIAIKIGKILDKALYSKFKKKGR